MATDIIARGMITEYKSGTNISFKENDDGSVTISASGNVSSEDTVARDTIDNHKLDKNNPHNVTAEQIGLNNVDNTADLDKPISTAVQTALNDKANTKHTHKKSDITDFPNSLPANGGNADTVNNHTVDSDVPAGAVFTDTVYDDTDIRAEITNKADTTSIPSKVSVLENDSKYQTESDVTTTLADYATKTYVGEQVANAEHLKREIVTVLPSDEEASDNVIYMLKVENATGNDKYQEYMKIDGTVQMVGDTSVDLTDYAKTVDVDTELNKKVNIADVQDNLESTDTTSPLSANQGRILNEKITEHTDNSNIHVTATDKDNWNGYANEIETNKTDISQLFDITKGGETVGGESSYTLKNAVDYPLLGLSLYGKSKQDGVPTPENPVEIVSVGDSGSMAVQSCGKNLLNYDAWKTVNINNGTAIFENNGISITATGNDAHTLYRYNIFPELARVFVIKGETITLSWEESTNTSGIVLIFPNGKEDGAVRCNNTLQKKLTYTVPSGVSFITFRFGVTSAGDTISYKNIMIERGSEATEFEPYNGATANITSALPLCGIPVESGGNYTDKDGQQWICDELIYNADGTGKIVKRTKLITIDGIKSKAIFMSTDTDNVITQFRSAIDNTLADTSIINMSYCSHLPVKYYQVSRSEHFYVCKDNGNIYIRCYANSDNVGTTETELNNWLASQNEANMPFRVIAALKNLQEIELTAAEMSALKQLQSFNGITNISNDGGADMDVKYCTNKTLSEYVAPVTAGLQAQIDELKAAVLSLGGNI